jgi:hypothetical protein
MLWRLDALLCLLTLASCAYERKWALSLRHSADLSMAARQAAATEARTHFGETLRSCVAANDPDALSDLDAGRAYPISEPSAKPVQLLAVMRCMKEKGWEAAPVTLYGF